MILGTVEIDWIAVEGFLGFTMDCGRVLGWLGLEFWLEILCGDIM